MAANVTVQVDNKAARIVEAILPELLAAIAASNLGWVVRKVSTNVAPLLLRWSVEIAIAKYGATLAEVLHGLLPILERVLHPDLMAVVRELDSILSSPTFDAPVLATCVPRPASAALFRVHP